MKRSPDIHRPDSVEALQDVVARATRIKAVGTGHTFNAIARSDELVSLERLPRVVTVDTDTAVVGAAVTYGEIALALQEQGLALENMASLPHISVGGAISTATHGSGDHARNLANAVRAIEFVTSNGDLVGVRRGDEYFDGVVVGLGAIGVVTSVTLDVVPTYEVRQDVFEGLAWNVLLDNFDAVMSSGDSVSVFTTWTEAVEQVWVKSRSSDGPAGLFGAQPATGDVHPVAGADPANCTPQLGRPGPWHERLPHFRMGFTPSVGDEIQSEFFVERDRAVEAIAAVRALGPLLRPSLFVSEIRTVAADQLWMSPQYERDSVAIHFTWRNEETVHRLVERVEAALEPFDARPHWGKLFTKRPQHPRAEDFAALAKRLDARGAFRNEWLDRYVL